MESIIREQKGGDQFVEFMNNGFSEKIGTGEKMQEMYELQQSLDDFLEPTELIVEVANVIERLNIDGNRFIQNDEEVFVQKKSVPIKQLFALYAINKISTTANTMKK